MLRLQADIRKAQAEKKFLIAVFLDPEKTFDLCSMSGSLLNSGTLALKERYSSLLTTFTRAQNNTQSDERQLDNGLPEGSVISPVLFNIAVNNLSDCIPEATSKLFQYISLFFSWLNSCLVNMANRKRKAQSTSDVEFNLVSNKKRGVNSSMDKGQAS